MNEAERSYLVGTHLKERRRLVKLRLDGGRGGQVTPESVTDRRGDLAAVPRPPLHSTGSEPSSSSGMKPAEVSSSVPSVASAICDPRGAASSRPSTALSVARSRGVR